MLKIGAVYTDKNNISYKIICICKYNDDEWIVFLQKRDKEKQKRQWRKLFNSIFAVFIAGLIFALGMQCGFALFVKIASVL